MPELTNPKTTPIRHSLPGDLGQYSDNDAVASILEPWEQQSALVYEDLLNFYERYMNPLTCKENALDWLAQLAGYSGVFWSSQWPVSAKRLLIQEAYTRVWPEYGSLNLIVWVFQAFDLSVDILSDGAPFRLDVSRFDVDRFGGETQTIHFLLPSKYDRAIEWRTVRHLLNLFVAVWVPYTLSYESFRFDVSRFGEIFTD